MNKILAILSLTAFLCCCGVQSAESYDDLRRQILNSGTVVFLDFLEKVRNATEKLVRDDQFRKSRISIQGHMKALRELAKPLKNTEDATESQDNSAISPRRLFTLMAGGTFAATIRQVFDKFFFPYMKIYRKTLKNETMADIWKEVESYYLPGAPPVYSKPMQFFSHLLAKAVVKSQLVNMLEAGVDTVMEIGKADFNQLHKDGQMVMDQIRQKAFEISILERQKEKNDFLISLRTASGLIVFYWDKVLEHTESPSFHAEYLDSMKQWAELTELKNSSEKYHVLLDPDTRRGFLNWTELNFGKFFEAAAQEYYNRGNAALGLDRFNQSNWAVVKSTVVYSLPVYEKLSEVGFGIAEVNRFLHKVNHITLILEGNDISSNRQTFLEFCIRGILYVLTPVIKEETTKSKDNQLLLPLRVIRTVVLELWRSFLQFQNYGNFQQIQSKWNDTKNDIINELLKSNAFTRKQLEEAPKNFVEAIHRTLEKLKQYTDLVDGFDERINPTFLALEHHAMHQYIMFNDVWDLLLE
ncbi:uncharacterized protein si:rp71-15k1.1 [Onychostoma macrolepis]|uniref:Uncharacterized protein n=1 Tax=Onychostoma macrolepis TaxID=369639 RepID=A0A7J6C062_9TELE|nr:uncharacterized protein si:rp71-15k1.1 [Onychostoma macrolepis]KAF4100668.1 hypothetical protein G5714_018864 [Onychostoma macrolepis]